MIKHSNGQLTIYKNIPCDFSNVFLRQSSKIPTHRLLEKAIIILITFNLKTSMQVCVCVYTHSPGPWRCPVKKLRNERGTVGLDSRLWILTQRSLVMQAGWEPLSSWMRTHVVIIMKKIARIFDFEVEYSPQCKQRVSETQSHWMQ